MKQRLSFDDTAINSPTDLPASSFEPLPIRDAHSGLHRYQYLMTSRNMLNLVLILVVVYMVFLHEISLNSFLEIAAVLGLLINNSAIIQDK